MADNTARAIHRQPGEGRASKTGIWTFKVLSDETAGRVSAIETYFQPGVLLAPPHIHRPEDQTIIVMKGQATFEIGDEIIVAPAGTTLFVPKGTRHTGWGSGSETAVVMEVGAPAGFEKYIMELDDMIASRNLDIPKMVERGLVYGCEYDLPHIGYLVQKYNLKLPGGMGV